MPYVADGRALVRDAFERHVSLPACTVCSPEAVRAGVEAERFLEEAAVFRVRVSVGTKHGWASALVVVRLREIAEQATRSLVHTAAVPERLALLPPSGWPW